MLEIALNCIRRGWYVFPCVPRDKRPLAGLVPRGFLDASNDEEVIRRWWTAKPDANVGIATGASGLLVVDIDHGLDGRLGFNDSPESLFEDTPLPTYAVRTGRRPELGIQLYFQADGSRNSAGWKENGCSGDIRGDGGYVLAAGSIHPSGEPYTVLADHPLRPVPEWVKSLAPVKAQYDPATAVDDETADAWKTWLLEYADHNKIEVREFEKRAPNGWWLGIRCPWVHASGDGAESSTVLGILDGRLAFECSHGTCKAAKRDTSVFRAEMLRLHGPFSPEPGIGPTVALGTGLPMTAPADWRELFHSQDEVLNCPPPAFLIENFLAKQSICAIAAPVAQRKSLIALNMARALVTGEPLFGCLPVLNRPSRVLYLCPEMGLISLSNRIRKMGLSGLIGESLFIRSMNLGNLELKDIPEDALYGSVLIVDTAIRFMKGAENDSEDMKAFSEVLFSVQRLQGPEGAVVILYHSPKATKDASDLTLENCLRGSGELGASLTDAHGTRLQDPQNPYESASFIRHIKPRDYEGMEDFEVSSDKETGILTRIGEEKAVLKIHTGGNKANRDGHDETAKAVIMANPDKSIRDIVDMLAEMGIKRGKTWVSNCRIASTGSGSKLSSVL